jgi:acetyltransferase-like isoleucine patch superfamily enzyme
MTDRPAPVQKVRKSRAQRFLRLLGSTFDPRAWAHFIKVMNFYNYSHVQELRKATVARGVSISPTASFANGQNIVIETGVAIGSHCQIWAGPGAGRITIRADVLFGPDVMVTAATYRYNDGAPVTKQAMDEADIEIGPDAWIGRGVTILAGARIGAGAIIAANSVVRGEIPAFAIAGGMPAKIIGQRTPTS